MFQQKLSGYGFMGNITALLATTGSHSDWRQLLLVLSVHILVCVVCAVIFVKILPERYAANKGMLFLFFFCFSFFIPVLGAVGLLLSLLYFRYIHRKTDRTEFFTVALPPFMTESDQASPGMGEGGAWSRLKAPQAPRQLRLKALLAVSTSSGHNTSRLLQLAAEDSDDEIRLLAFNLYDRREKVISSSISQTLQVLRETTDRIERRNLYRSLAFSYWEMVYNDLARDELAEFFVRQSLAYAQKALEMGDNEADPALMILIGRIFLKKGDTGKAEEAILAALKQGALRERVIPYLAELAFLRRNFLELNQYFKTDPLLCHKPGIGPVVKFWMGS